MREVLSADNPPSLVSSRRPHIKTIRLKVKKPKRSLKELGLDKFNKRQKQALANIASMGLDNKKEAVIDAGYAESSATRTADRLLQSRPVVKALEKKKVDIARVAEVIDEGLEATHPLSKQNKKDYKAIAKFLQETNKILGLYAPTKVQSEEKHIILNITPEDIKSHKKVKEMREELVRDPV